MSYTGSQLNTIYQNALVGVAPTSGLQAYLAAIAAQNAAGGYSDAQTLQIVLDYAQSTTDVALATYQFFTGAAPSQAGLKYLVNSASTDASYNPNTLNSTYYSAFNTENRYYNFAINLATGSGAGAANFAATYGALSIADTLNIAYEQIVGTSNVGGAAAAAVAKAGILSALSYFQGLAVSRAGTTQGTAAYDLATKAIMIGYIMEEAIKAHVGSLSNAVNAFDGVLGNGGTPAYGADIIAAYPSVTTGQSYSLTTGIDNLVGTAANDTFNAVQSTSSVINSLDTVDGGGGVNTLNISDTLTAAGAGFTLTGGFSAKNIQTLNVNTNGALGTSATRFDVSGIGGLTKATLQAGGTAGSYVKAADTTAVTLGVNNQAVDLVGGSSVTIAGATTATVTGAALSTASISATGAVTVTGAALTNVTVATGGFTTIDNTDSNGVSGKGATLTAVTLNGEFSAAVKGAALTTLNLSGQGQGSSPASETITVTNGTKGHALTINANGAGATGDVTTVTDAVATSVTVNTTAASVISLATDTLATSVTLTGAGALTLSTGTAVTSIDASGASGAVSLGSIGATTLKGGAGAVTATLTATTAETVTLGAGNDVITLGSTVAAGSNINLGGGNNSLLNNGGSIAANTSTATTVIDGGVGGINTLAASLVNAGDAAVFKDFQVLNLDSTTGFDLSLLTNDTITALAIASATSNATYQNVSTPQGLTDTFAGINAATTTLTFANASGGADSYNIAFNAAAIKTAASAVDVNAGTLSIEGIETVNIASGGANHWNAITLSDAAASSVVITGASNLTLSFAAGFGSTSGVTLIDGSAATGALNINEANITAGSTIVIKGGAGADTLTTSSFSSTLTGGGGADTFNVQSTLTGSITAPKVTTITDFAKGDTITLAHVGADTFATAAVNVSTATTLFNGTINATDLAAPASVGVGTVSWFQYGGNTYLEEHTGGAGFGTGDVLVKLVGLIDLSKATFTAAVGGDTLTL